MEKAKRSSFLFNVPVPLQEKDNKDLKDDNDTRRDTRDNLLGVLFGVVIVLKVFIVLCPAVPIVVQRRVNA